MPKRRGHGEGSVYKRQDGRWAAVLSLGYRNGKRHRKHFYGRTQREVVAQMREAQQAHQKGLPLSDERQTVSSFFTRWLETERPVLRASTWERYEQLVRLHVLPELGHMRLGRLEPRHLRELYARKSGEGLSSGTIGNVHRVLHRALKEAAAEGQVARNVAALVKPPRPERREMHPLDMGQADRLMNAAEGTRLEALYVLAITTGMRRGELLGLHWADVDLASARLFVRWSLSRSTGSGFQFREPKSKSSRRVIELSSQPVDALRRHRASQLEERLVAGPEWRDMDLVFTNALGGPLEPQNLLVREFRPLLVRAGLPAIRFHDLRHTAASLLLEQGIHPKIVSEMLGHSQSQITMDLYSHVTPTMQRSAVEALDQALKGARIARRALEPGEG